MFTFSSFFVLQFSVSMNFITEVPSSFFANNPRLGFIDLSRNYISTFNRDWLISSVLLTDLITKENPSTCSLHPFGNVPICQCASGHVEGPSGFCVKPCSPTIEDAARGFSMNASRCPGFVNGQIYSAPCIVNTTLPADTYETINPSPFLF
jgi:hypothetical protein